MIFEGTDFLRKALFKRDRPVISSFAKHVLSVREVWGSIPRPVELAQCFQQLVTAATFLRSCVAKPRRGAAPLATPFIAIPRV